MVQEVSDSSLPGERASRRPHGDGLAQGGGGHGGARRGAAPQRAGVDVDESAASAAGARGHAVVRLGPHPHGPLHGLGRQVGPVGLVGRGPAGSPLELLLGAAAAESEVVAILFVRL